MMMQLKPVEDQVVVIFGASSGIGRATALEFADRGARIVVAARDREGLDSLLEGIHSQGGEATAVVADTAVPEQVQNVAEEAIRTFGRIDTWVHVAAIALFARFEETTLEEFRRLIDVNLMGQIHGAKAALPHLRNEGRGALILVASVEGRVALPNQSAYAMTKHGIIGFADALRIELKEEGTPISVTTILPATINTPLFDNARTKIGTKPKGVPPFYAAELVAEAIVRAAEHPMREIIVGGAGKGLVLSHKIAPRLTEAVLSLIGTRGEQTDEPKSPDAPDNFYEPLPGNNRVEGTLDGRTHQRCAYTWLSTHTRAKWLLTAAGVVLAAAILAPPRRGVRRP